MAPRDARAHGRRAVTLIAQLPDLLDRIRKLEQQMIELSESG